MKREYKYGKPVERDELPKETRRFPQYDECLEEFLATPDEVWKVNMDALPSRNIRLVLSSLKWRTKHKREFKEIKVFMRKNNVYLEKKSHFVTGDFIE